MPDQNSALQRKVQVNPPFELLIKTDFLEVKFRRYEFINPDLALVQSLQYFFPFLFSSD